jgi:hypothetical protein
MAKIETRPDPLRFRDTFAAELLQVAFRLSASHYCWATEAQNNREILRCVDTGSTTSS